MSDEPKVKTADGLTLYEPDPVELPSGVTWYANQRRGTDDELSSWAWRVNDHDHGVVFRKVASDMRAIPSHQYIGHRWAGRIAAQLDVATDLIDALAAIVATDTRPCASCGHPANVHGRKCWQQKTEAPVVREPPPGFEPATAIYGGGNTSFCDCPSFLARDRVGGEEAPVPRGQEVAGRRQGGQEGLVPPVLRRGLREAREPGFDPAASRESMTNSLKEILRLSRVEGVESAAVEYRSREGRYVVSLVLREGVSPDEVVEQVDSNLEGLRRRHVLPDPIRVEAAREAPPSPAGSESPSRSADLISALRAIRGELERIADALAGTDEEGSTPGVAESLVVLALDVLDPQDDSSGGPEPEDKPS